MKNNVTQVMQKVIERVETCRGNGVAYPGIPTGYADLDEKLSGFQPGELVLLAGTPAMGKTVLALNFAWNIASQVRKPVIFFSCELAAENLARTIMSRIGGINRVKLRCGALQENDWQKLMTAFNRIASVPIHLVDEVLDAEGMRVYAGKVKESSGDLGLIVVDGLQALQRAHESLESAAVMKTLKLTARELNAPVLVLSDLNRALEMRDDKRPVLHDISNYEAVVPNCDVVLSIYRDEVYNDESAEKDIAEIRVIKQNDGPVGGRVSLSFRGEYGRFSDAPHANEVLHY